VIPYDAVTSNFNLCYPYPSQEVKKLQNVIASGDENQIGSCIDVLLQYIVDNDMPTYLARSICADILKALLNDSQNIVSDVNQLSEMLMQLSKAESFNQLLAIVNSARSGINNRTETVSTTSDSKLLSEILAYIADNYHRCDFSMNEVAVHFSILPSNLSAFFKDNMQCTMMDYLIKLRMNLAKELLRSTSLPLQIICERVGYYNVSSFSRRFKTYEGITPNTYRFQNQ
jgi:YesN/AraC family two-component response regulator